MGIRIPLTGTWSQRKDTSLKNLAIEKKTKQHFKANKANALFYCLRTLLNKNPSKSFIAQVPTSQNLHREPSSACLLASRPGP